VGGSAAHTARHKDPVSGSNCLLRSASRHVIFLNKGPDRGVYTIKEQDWRDWGVRECADCKN